LYGHWQWYEGRLRWEPSAGFWNRDWELSREEVKRTMPLSDPYNNYIHLLLTFVDGSQLAFSDMRTFARIELLPCLEVEDKLASTLGIEPLDPQTTCEVFCATIKQKPQKKIKSALLDQTLVCGFGNIYTDELLFASRVHPARLVGTISDTQWQVIYKEGRRILQQAIKSGGDSMGDYRRVDGTGGDFQNFHQVYQKEGTPCPYCGADIQKAKIDQRIGRYCPKCQQ
jgi:formamidopyrimidine-DNA glycosylase